MMSFTVISYFTFETFKKNDNGCYLYPVLRINHIHTILFTSNHFLFNYPFTISFITMIV